MLSKYYSDNNIHPYISTQEMFAISHIISRDFSPVAPIKVPEPVLEKTLSTKKLLETVKILVFTTLQNLIPL